SADHSSCVGVIKPLFDHSVQLRSLLRVQIITIDYLQLHLRSLGELRWLVDDKASVDHFVSARVHGRYLPHRIAIIDVRVFRYPPIITPLKIVFAEGGTRLAGNY